MTITPELTTREVAIQHPETISVFEELGIDYCCGGASTLAESCKAAHIDWTRMTELLQAAETPASPQRTDWAGQPLDSLARHIADTHHRYARAASIRIQHWLDKVVDKHGARHPEVREIAVVFRTLAAELASHMMKEEHVLFPYIEALAAANRTDRKVQAPLFGSVGNPIHQMMTEHDSAGQQMAQIRATSGGYKPPADACPTFRGLYHGLLEFERDLHQHVHLENNILFPRAFELEHRLLSNKG